MKTSEIESGLVPAVQDSAAGEGRKRKIPRFGIRFHIFTGFTIFVAVIVALLWIFQIAMLNSFYRMIRKAEVKSTMSDVISCINDDDFESKMLDICRNQNLEVLITDENGIGKFTQVNGRSELFDYIISSNAAEMYQETVENGGELSLTIDNTDSTSSYNYYFEDFGIPGRSKKYEDSEIYVNVRICSAESGESLMVMLTAGLVPIDSTITTLKVQLWVLTAVMIILSAILALAISRRLSQPIEAINSSAKELAKGSYDTEFTESGSKEIAELAGTLNYARVELSKVDGLRRELIANVSHDLRTPLTMIKGYSEVMRDIPGENTPENVQVIIDETERLTSLVNDMLDISKLESGTITLDRATVNITSSVKAILHRYDKLADYRFIFNYDNEVYVDGDELKLSQVIYNLVNNAITYTGEDKTITIDQKKSGGKVTISVSDTGEGIPADKLPYIWERYYKVDKAHKRAQRGTGLGLSIVKKIVDMHGGTYGVTSVEGEGSTFYFTLDTVDAPAEDE